jgi:uncharacterized protein
MSSQTTYNHTMNQDLIRDLKPIATVSELRKTIGKPVKSLAKRVQSSLDQFSLEFIEHATAAVLATDSVQLPMQFVNFHQHSVRYLDENKLCLSHHFHDLDTEETSANSSLYFIVPGIGHSLRINGRLIISKSKPSVFYINEIYFHCARAAARAKLWDLPSTYLNNSHFDTKTPNVDLSTEFFLRHSPFILIKTQNSQATTEISPRGDSNGFIHQLSSNTLLIPERPGNKVAVSLCNIIDQPNIELLCVIPGLNLVLNISGQAQIIASPALLKSCSVNGKQPKLGILVTIKSQSIRTDLALSNSKIWQIENLVDPKLITSFPKALSAHMNGTGLLGLATANLVKAVVNHDMKNLY